MSVLAAGSDRPDLSDAQRWVALSILLAMLVICLLSWLHFAQRDALQSARRQSAEIRQARIELTKGFLVASLAHGPGSPFGRDDGLALLDQAVQSFEHAAAANSGGNAQDAAAFRHSVEAFRQRLDAWRGAVAPMPGDLVALRIAFSDLEHRADRLDAAGQSRMDDLQASSDRIYAYSLAGSILALAVIVTIVLAMARKERRADAEQQRLDRARRESDARFEATFEQAAMGIAIVATDGRWLRVNRKLCEIVGYTESELLAGCFQDITHRDDLELDLGQARRLLAGEIDTYSIEKRYLRKGGGLVWINLTGALAKRIDGSPDYFIAVVENISARKQVEAALRESQERLQLLIDHAPASMAMFDRDMRYLAVSHRWMVDYGLGEREILGLSHYEVFPDIGDAWKAVHQLGLSGEIVGRDEDRFERADGSVQWLRWEVRPWHSADSGVGGIVIFTEDITATREAAEALRDSESRLRATVDTALDSIIVIDSGGHIVEFNPAAEQCFGYQRAEVLGRELAPLIIPERHREAHRLGLQRLRDGPAAGDMLGRRTEVTALRAEGSEFAAELAVEMVHRDRGSLFVAYLRDISERLRDRQKILDLNANLERGVAERTAELSAANRELDAFAYAVSHDLRAPLRAMNGFSQALEEDYGDKLEGEAKDYLAQIRIASRRMGDLIDGILTLSRSTRGEVRRDDVDLSAIARRRLDECAHFEPERRVAVSVEDGLRVRGDHRMLEAVLGNLIDNAWKYTAKADAPSVRVYSDMRDGHCWFCVADNGTGFDMTHAARLFQPFQRLHRQDEFPGLGIGLATVQRIIHRHGGEIVARGATGHGATFRFRLDTGGSFGEPT